MDTFGKRLIAVRKEKKLSQGEVAKQVGTMAVVIGRYERDEVKPSIEVAAKLAQTLGVSLDYLVGSTDLHLDTDIIKRIMDIQKLPNEDKNHIFFLIDGLLRDAKARQTYG